MNDVLRPYIGMGLDTLVGISVACSIWAPGLAAYATTNPLGAAYCAALILMTFLVGLSLGRDIARFGGAP